MPFLPAVFLTLWISLLFGISPATPNDRGKVTRTIMDGLQRPTSVTDDLGGLAAESQTVYSSTGLVWKAIDPLLRETEMEYDSVGRSVGVWQPDPDPTGNGTVNRAHPNDPLLGSPRNRTAYDKNSNVVVSINPLGYRWEFEYDARNRKILERQPTVTETEIVGGLPQETAFQNPEIQIAYDGVGNAIATTDARGHTVRSFHDNAYRVTATLSNPVTGNPATTVTIPPAGNDILTQMDFDPNGNAIEVIDGNGNATRNGYDRLNRLVATATNPNDGDPNAPPASPKGDDIVVSNHYDDSGNLVQVEDGEGHLTGFRYDGLGRKTLTLWDETSTVQGTEKAVFDGVVQLQRIRNPGESFEQITTYQYDDLNRLEDVIYTGASADNRHYDYDPVGNLIEVSYPNESATRKILRGSTQVFDKLNRLAEETSAGATHEHFYDKAGNRRRTIYAGQNPRTINSSYDKLNRLLSLTESGNSVTSYGYDLNGNITRKVLPNGSGSLCTFDSLNRKLTEATRDGEGAGALISTFDYSLPHAGCPSGYDNVGNVLKISEEYGHADVNNRTVTNIYDAVYRIDTEVIVETGGPTITTAYEYDDANNRKSKIVTGGSNPGTWISAYGTTTDAYNSNQLKTVTKDGVVTSFLYDANGNRETKKVGINTVQTYGFDFENRLTSLIDSVKGTFAYAYDHRTRRVGREESSASGASEEISFADGLSVQEYTTGSGTPTVEYIRGSDYGGGIGGVLYTIRSGSVRSYNAYNSRGDVVSKTNDGGAITWQSAYEAFGTRIDEEGSTFDRQKANTKDEDPTGLLNEGMRYRDLEFGVFLTRDPAGFVDGPNVYTYVRQNPWTFFDPLGLATMMTDDDGPKSTIVDTPRQDPVESIADEEARRWSPRAVDEADSKSARENFETGMILARAIWGGSASDFYHHAGGEAAIRGYGDLFYEYSGYKADFDDDGERRKTLTTGAVWAGYIASFIEPGPFGEAIMGSGTAVKGYNALRGSRAVNPNIGGGSIVGSRFEKEIYHMATKGEMNMPVMSRDYSIRHLMSDVTAVTGNEVGLFRLADGRRVLRMGGSDFVGVGSDVTRVIGHTHPSGVLQYSGVDLI